MIKVKNVTGSSKVSPNPPIGYISWLDYWEKNARQTATRCGAIDCKRPGRNNLVGAHVQKVYDSDKKWYIVPLCLSCNQRTDDFYVDLTLIPSPNNL